MMGQLDAEKALLRQPAERRRLSPPEIVDYLRSLPTLWAEAGPEGRQALVVSIFARLDVLGFSGSNTSSPPMRSTSVWTRRCRPSLSSTARFLSLVGARGVAPPEPTLVSPILTLTIELSGRNRWSDSSTG